MEDIKTQLKTMYEADQHTRKAAMAGQQKWDEEMDKIHSSCLKHIVETMGWPSISKVGKEGAMHAWILAQHADHDVAFQRACLEQMKELPVGEVEQWQIAYLTDRILALGEGKPQRYGTQFFQEGDGPVQPHPIEHPEQLNERRASMGLAPFKEWQ